MNEALHRYPFFHSRSAEECERAAIAHLGATKVEIKKSDKFYFKWNLLRLENIALGFTSTSGGVVAEFPEIDFAGQQFSLRGQGVSTINNVTTQTDDRQSGVISPGQKARWKTADSHDRLILRVDAKALQQNLTAMLGYKPRGKLEFALSSSLDPPNVSSLQRLVVFLAEQFDATFAEMPPLVLKELEQAIIISFLYANRSTFSHLLEQSVSGVSPREVRDAEEYIEANWNRPISILELARVSNVSARSLFKSFRKARGYSPMAFAKLARLKHAKGMLTADNPNISVTSIAFKCGFGNLGHFASYYREAFGELPSETLARARGK